MTALTEGLLVAGVVGTGLVSGILFIFSNTIMAALARQGPEAGAAGMVAINEIILNPLFFLFFLGTAVVCLAVGALAIVNGHGARTVILLASGAYIVGVFVVTAAVNVPLNDRLAAVPPGTEEALELWDLYLRRWTRWNTLRVMAGTASTVLFALSLTGS